MFDNFWIKRLQQSIESKITRDTIDDKSDYFIVPATIYSGFANLTENGIQANNTLISDYTSFSKVFTGKSGIVAVLDGALHLYAKKIPEIFDREYTLIREFTENDIINSLTKNSSFLEIRLLNTSTGITTSNNYFYNDNGNFIDDNGNIIDNVSNILTYWNNNEIDNNIIKEYYINVVDLNKISNVLNTNYKRVLQSPNYFKGCLDDVSFGANFSNLPQQSQIGQYVSLTSSRTITMSTTKQLFKEDVFKFYLIPFPSKNDNYNDNEWFFISDVKPYYSIDNKFIYNTISFTSINDSIRETGQTIDQFIQTGSMGEGKIIPLVKFDNNGKPLSIDINYDLAVDVGVNTLQLEILGPAANAGVKVIGRPFKQKGTISSEVYAPRNLYIYKMKYPVSNNLSQNSNPDNSYYLTNGVPIINKYYESWQSRLSANISQNYKQRFEGFLECDANTKDTNTGDSSSTKFNIISTGFNLKNSKVLTNNNLITKLNPYFSITLPTNEVVGNLSFNINNLSKSLIGASDILNLNYECFTWLEQLNIDIKQTTIWNLKNIPLIGGFANSLTLGIPIGWRDEIYANNEAFPHIEKSHPLFLISSSIYDWYTQSFFGVSEGDTNRTNALPLDLFRTGTIDEVGSIIGTSSSNSCLTFSLSDKIVANRFSISQNKVIGKEIISTLYLGEKDPYNLDNIFIIGNDWEVLDPLTETKYTDIIGNKNYIVDFISYLGLSKSDIRITSYYEDPDLPSSIIPYSTQNYYVVISSSAKMTNSIRNWRTDYKMSYLDNYIQDEVQFTFPTFKPLPEPIINGVKTKEEDLSKFSKTFISKQTLDTSRYSGSETKTIELMDMRKYGILTIEQFENYYKEVQLEFSSHAYGRTRYHERIFGVYSNEKNTYWDSEIGIKSDNIKKYSQTKREQLIDNSNTLWHFNIKDLVNKVRLTKHNVNFVDVNADSYDLVNTNYSYENYIYFENGIIKMDYIVNWNCNGEGHGVGIQIWYMDTSLTLYHSFGYIDVIGK